MPVLLFCFFFPFHELGGDQQIPTETMSYTQHRDSFYFPEGELYIYFFFSYDVHAGEL